MAFGKIKLKNFELKKSNLKLINDLKLLIKENNKKNLNLIISKSGNTL